MSERDTECYNKSQIHVVWKKTLKKKAKIYLELNDKKGFALIALSTHNNKVHRENILPAIAKMRLSLR